MPSPPHTHTIWAVIGWFIGRLIDWLVVGAALHFDSQKLTREHIHIFGIRFFELTNYTTTPQYRPFILSTCLASCLLPPHPAPRLSCTPAIRPVLRRTSWLAPRSWSPALSTLWTRSSPAQRAPRGSTVQWLIDRLSATFSRVMSPLLEPAYKFS